MEELWSKSDPEVWQAALDALDQRVAEHGKEGYAELDRWLFKELPAKIVAAPDERSVDAADLVKTVEWKLKRGSWRPKLLDYAKSISPKEIKEASKQAFLKASKASQGDDTAYREAVKEALNILTKLKGVGPATASALLTAAEPSFPYMSDEAMDVSLKRPREYTIKRYVEYAAAIRQKAQELSSKGSAWTAQAVERAIQSEALLHAKPVKKRKRPA